MEQEVPNNNQLHKENRTRNERFLPEGSSASRAIQPQRSSSLGVSRLIQGYKERERLVFEQDKLNGTIELTPQMKISYGKIHVEFKIGGKKKYVLKNTQVFADSLRRREFFKYGKELEFYHTLEAFTQESRRLAEFLIQEAETRSMGRTSWEYYGNKGRYVEIDSGNMDSFFDAVGSMEFAVEVDYGAKRMSVPRNIRMTARFDPA